MKKCTGCKQEKSTEEFQWKNKKKGERHYRCKECFKEINRMWYQNNKEKSRNRTKNHKLKSRLFMFNYLKQVVCIDCGENNPACLDFDHRSNKKFNLAKAHNGYSIETLKEEIKKCDIRCSNCHRKKTAKEQGWYEFARG